MRGARITMNYLEAKIELLEEVPQINPGLMIIEAVALVGIAGILVQIFDWANLRTKSRNASV